MPILTFFIAVIALWAAAWGGARLRSRWPISQTQRDDYSIVLAATLTLLGLIIGFTFSMAGSRYDQRKNLEAAEANAIGTEYTRADLLPPANAERLRVLLRNYLDARISFYTSYDSADFAQIDERRAKLEPRLWAAVRDPALRTPTPISGLAVSGMNDVLNAAAYTQAAWWNRIPVAAWTLMIAIAICCNGLIGYGSRQAKGQPSYFFIVPVVAAIAFMLISDLDSSANGFVHVTPQNLISLATSLRPH